MSLRVSTPTGCPPSSTSTPALELSRFVRSVTLIPTPTMGSGGSEMSLTLSSSTDESRVVASRRPSSLSEPETSFAASGSSSVTVTSNCETSF